MLCAEREGLLRKIFIFKCAFCYPDLIFTCSVFIHDDSGAVCEARKEEVAFNGSGLFVSRV